MYVSGDIKDCFQRTLKGASFFAQAQIAIKRSQRRIKSETFILDCLLYERSVGADCFVELSSYYGDSVGNIVLAFMEFGLKKSCYETRNINLSLDDFSSYLKRYCFFFLLSS